MTTPRRPPAAPGFGVFGPAPLCPICGEGIERGYMETWPSYLPVGFGVGIYAGRSGPFRMHHRCEVRVGARRRRRGLVPRTLHDALKATAWHQASPEERNRQPQCVREMFERAVARSEAKSRPHGETRPLAES